MICFCWLSLEKESLGVLQGLTVFYAFGVLQALGLSTEEVVVMAMVFAPLFGKVLPIKSTRGVALIVRKTKTPKNTPNHGQNHEKPFSKP